VKYGAVFPQTEIGSDPAGVRQYLQAIDEMGFDYVLAYVLRTEQGRTESGYTRRMRQFASDKPYRAYRPFIYNLWNQTPRRNWESSAMQQTVIQLETAIFGRDNESSTGIYCRGQ
jgi:hypothetical protein